MTWRNSVRKRCGAVVIAATVCGLVPAAPVWAEEPLESGTTSPDEPVAESASETGELGGATVAVGAPPVPSASEAPQVAVGQPPVPPASEAPQVAVGQPPVPPAALLETVHAALDLVGDCL